MGKNRKNAEKGGEHKLVSWESGRNILVSLLYLATQGCGQIYNKHIPAGLQDRVKLTPRSSRQVEGCTGTGPGRREPACLNKAQSTDCSTGAGPAQLCSPGLFPWPFPGAGLGLCPFWEASFPKCEHHHQSLAGRLLQTPVPFPALTGHPKPRLPPHCDSKAPGDTEKRKVSIRAPSFPNQPFPELSLRVWLDIAMLHRGWDTPQTFAEVKRPEKGRFSVILSNIAGYC